MNKLINHAFDLYTIKLYNVNTLEDRIKLQNDRGPDSLYKQLDMIFDVYDKNNQSNRIIDK